MKQCTIFTLRSNRIEVLDLSNNNKKKLPFKIKPLLKIHSITTKGLKVFNL